MTTSKDSRSTACAIGVDVGGTKCAAGIVVFPEGRVVARRWQPTQPERGGAAVLSDVVQLTRSLQNEAAKLEINPTVLGVGLAELVGVNGEVLSAATIRWKGMAVRDELQTETGMPVTLEADVRAAARGEAHLGAGRDFRTFLYVTVGTGISGSIVIDRAPYAGAWGLSGTFASSRVTIPGDNGELITGPALEEFAAGPALAARFKIACPDFTGAAPEVVLFAETGDDAARSVVVSAGRALGAAIGHLVNVLDPQAVVIGGGLGVTEGMYREALVSGLRSHVYSDMHRDIAVLSARLGDDGGFIGAALSAISP